MDARKDLLEERPDDDSSGHGRVARLDAESVGEPEGDDTAGHRLSR